MKRSLTEDEIKAATLYRDPDNSMSYIEYACGIGHKKIYAAIDALGVPRRTTAKRSRRHRIAMSRASAIR